MKTYFNHRTSWKIYRNFHSSIKIKHCDIASSLLDIKMGSSLQISTCSLQKNIALELEKIQSIFV